MDDDSTGTEPKYDAPRLELPATSLLVLWVLAILALGWWLLVALFGLLHGEIGDCWPTDRSSATWIPVVLFGIVGVALDLAASYGLVTRTRRWLVAGLLCLLLVPLFLIVGPSGLGLIGSAAPQQC